MYCTPWTTEYTAKTAGSSCPTHAQPAQSQSTRTFRMSPQTTCGMWAAASATASILLTQTGALTPVSSLFVLLISFLVLLIVVLSLSGLTGLISNLVGLMKRLSSLTIRIEDIAIGMKTGE